MSSDKINNLEPGGIYIEVTDPYNQENDFLLGQCQTKHKLLEMKEGDLVFLFPEDGHMPGLSLGKASNNKKIVVKIPV